MALTENQVVDLIKSVTGDVLQKEKELDLESFKIICKNYIQAIDTQLKSLRNRKSLMDRVLAVGKFMHDDQAQMQKMLILSHSFENAFNNFLGRKIPITWVTTSGKVFISSQENTIDLYGSAKSAVRQSNTSGRIYTGKIRGIRQDMFNKEMLDPELKDLQEKINKSAQGKQGLFQEAKRRYFKSETMSYAKKHQNQIKNIYWSIDKKDGNPKHFSKRISSPGYIGEGYVAMLLTTAHENVTIPHDPPPYDGSTENYIKIIAVAAAKGDAIPGIIQGDIKANENGSVQLAIKQGRSFSAASISGNIGIAYAFLATTQTDLLSKETIKEKLEEMGKKWSSVSWEKIFEEISGQLAKGFELNFNFDIT